MHPLAAIPEGRLRRWQVPALVVAGVCLAALASVLPDRADDTLIELVESGSVAASREILAHWSADERVRVAYAVGFDYLMNPAYMCVLAIAAVWAGRVWRSGRAARFADALAWLATSVVVTNVVENIGLFVALSSGPAAPWPPLVMAAHYWAGVVVLLLVLFIVVGAVRRIASPSSEA